jgi:hypothetical protein
MTEEVQSLRVLKFIVLSMGVVLILGTILLFAALINKSKQDIKLCSRDINITLPAAVQSFDQDDYEVTFLTKEENGKQFLSILDLCKQKSQVITIEVEPTYQQTDTTD